MNMADPLKDSYEALMLGYAAGALDAAQDLIVSSHVALSEKGRARAARYEALGGALLSKSCDPVEMSAGALDNVLARLEDGQERASEANGMIFPDKIEIPDNLSQAIAEIIGTPQWENYIPGFKTFELPVPCRESKARFLKAVPGVKSPHHKHGGVEITLVLDGAFEDETGTYNRGDLIVMEDDYIEHTPVACEMRGCVCMIVTTAPLKLTGIASVLNPFIKQ